MNAITPHETSRLEALELVIKQGRDSFLAVGMALAQINRDRLYRQDYSSFEEYLSAKWDISKARGYQLIAFARDCEASADGESKPVNERQARKARQKPSTVVDALPPARPHEVEPELTAGEIEELEKPNPSASFLKACGNPVLTEIAAKVEPATFLYHQKQQQLTAEAVLDGTLKQLNSLLMAMVDCTAKIKQQIRLLESKKSHSSPILSESSPESHALCMGSKP